MGGVFDSLLSSLLSEKAERVILRDGNEYRERTLNKLAFLRTIRRSFT